MPLRAPIHALLRAINHPPAHAGRTLVLYYLALAALVAGLTYAAPDLVGHLLPDFGPAAGVAQQLGLEAEGGRSADPRFSLWFDLRLVATMVVALALMIPTSWVYMATRRKRGFDQAIVQTMMVLPLAVAGIILVVHNSLALAFSLAGVVAAVRFRSTLKESSDMLYIFLAIAVGLAAGVGALAAAAIVSATFNLVTLTIWHCGVEDCPLAGEEHTHGAGYLGGAARSLGEGHRRHGDAPEPPKKKKKRRFDAILSIQAIDLKPAQAAVEQVLDAEAKRWQIDEIYPKKNGKGVLKYVVRFDADTQPEAVLEALLSRGAPHVVGVALH